MNEKKFVEEVKAILSRDYEIKWEKEKHTVNLNLPVNIGTEQLLDGLKTLLPFGIRNFAYRGEVTPDNFSWEKLLEVGQPLPKLDKEMAKVWKKVYGELKAMSLAGTLDKKYKGVPVPAVAKALWKHPKVGNSQTMPDAELWTRLTANLADRLKPKAKGDFDLELELDF